MNFVGATFQSPVLCPSLERGNRLRWVWIIKNLYSQIQYDYQIYFSFDSIHPRLSDFPLCLPQAGKGGHKLKLQKYSTPPSNDGTPQEGNLAQSTSGLTAPPLHLSTVCRKEDIIVQATTRSPLRNS